MESNQEKAEKHIKDQITNMFAISKDIYFCDLENMQAFMDLGEHSQADDFLRKVIKPMMLIKKIVKEEFKIEGDK